ncbi:MAG: hypothetical protein L3K17_01000 [Thermoplasmata archaeon]|nr:hypothetical protein [Thermoplasmata archaeon]
MPDARATRIDLVMAHWCPHCAPLSLELGEKLSQQLKVPLRILDIDVPAEEDLADDLVRKFGDWTDDYLIPQVFVAYEDGRVEHLLTGVPGPISGTRREWERVLAAH